MPTTERRAIVIENDEGMAQLIAAVLASEGIRAEISADAMAGFLRVRDSRPDLVVMAFFQDGFSGERAFKEMQKDAVLAHIPVIVCTAQRENTLGRRLGAPPPCTLYKPFTVDQLRSAVRQSLDTRAAA